MATKTVVALFDDITTARSVIQELVDNGFSRDQISLVAGDTSGEYSRYFGDRTASAVEDETTSGAGLGAGIGAVLGGLGGLLVGIGALAIPGIGPVLAAGPLATGIAAIAGAGVGAVAGGVTGGLIGALVDMGIPEEQAGYYTEGVRRGGTLVTVQTDDWMHDRALEIMNRFDPVNIQERVNTWRQQGWTEFNPDERSHTDENLSRERASYSSMDDDYDVYTDRFREHFEENLANDGYTYDYYEPAYRYGYDLAHEDHFSVRDWDDFEVTAREKWERDHPGTWEEFKATIRHAWEEVKDALD